MPSPSLLAAALVSVATGVSFAFVARAVAQGRLAAAAHASWWGALGAYLVLQGAMTAAAAYGALAPRTYLASRVVAVPLLCTAVWGITSYLLFLYSGRRGVFLHVAWFYALVAALFYYVTFAGGGRSVVIGDWLVGLDDSGALIRVVYVLVGVPPLMAALAYLLLLGVVHDRRRRYRIILLSSSILAYVGFGLAARLAAGELVIFLSIIAMGILAAGASLAAFYPPPAVARWLEKSPVREAKTKTAMDRRLEELI